MERNEGMKKKEHVAAIAENLIHSQGHSTETRWLTRNRAAFAAPPWDCKKALRHREDRKPGGP